MDSFTQILGVLRFEGRRDFDLDVIRDLVMCDEVRSMGDKELGSGIVAETFQIQPAIWLLGLHPKTNSRYAACSQRLKT